jgi:CPA1 family monovalent cation:H+ antiporter
MPQAMEDRMAVALLIAGLMIGLARAFQAPPLNKELLFPFFLPGLIFAAGFHIDFKEFWRNRLAIASLAVPGVVSATALTASILTPVAGTLHFASGLNWREARVFGALVSATNPIAVVTIFRNLGAPKRLAVLLDGKSLLNDGTAIVFFTLNLALVSGAQVTFGALLPQRRKGLPTAIENWQSPARLLLSAKCRTRLPQPNRLRRRGSFSAG